MNIFDWALRQMRPILLQYVSLEWQAERAHCKLEFVQILNIFHQDLMNCKLQPPSCSNIYLGKNIQCSVSVNQMLIGRSYRILVWHDDRSHKSVTGVQASLWGWVESRKSWLAKGQISELEGFSLTIDCCPFSENKLFLCVLKFWLENGIIWIGTWTSLRREERSNFCDLLPSAQ